MSNLQVQHSFSQISSLGPEKKLAGRSIKVALPDWSSIDTVLRSSKPFVLWQVGDQYLIYHWLDYALNNSVSKIIFLCSDRPSIVRNALERATLWPVDWELRAVSSWDPEAVDFIADRLPDQPIPSLLPTDGWSLLDYYFKINADWLNALKERIDFPIDNLAIGRFCSIHSSVKINHPVWIGDNVYIGPNSEIGPFAHIGEGSRLLGSTHVSFSMIAPRTLLGLHTSLQRAYLMGGRLINLKVRADVPRVDALVARSLSREKNLQKPSILERLEALYLFLYYSFLARKYETKIIQWKTFFGLDLKESNQGPLPVRRRFWLWQVACGRMRLIGILPREKSSLDHLTAEWRDILLSAPVGVFSYADICGVYSAKDPMESIHAVYQATQPYADMKAIIKANFKTLFLRNPDERP